MSSNNNIISMLKKDTNNDKDIVYRKKIINNEEIYIVYDESLTGSNTISDFIIRSLDSIEYKYQEIDDLYTRVLNDINNFKVTKIKDYKDVCYYLHNGFTILIFDNDKYIALESKKNLTRGITEPSVETTLRGAMDSFVEEIQTNIGLVKRRIKSNDLWSISNDVGKYTKTKTTVLYINEVCKKDKVEYVNNLIKDIDIDGIVSSGNIKNLIEKENKSVFPTILTTQRPDRAAKALLDGKIVIIVDGSPYCLILPALLNDFFLNSEDMYGKSINVSFTRFVRYLAFFIAVLTPSVYIAITTYNQELLPTDLLISFASQRESVPFPAFFEAIIMIFSFEILRESDLRIPSFSSSALSIVGALILGEAAVNAGIVSPIMIIVVSITAISALPFSEPEIINGIRWWRLIFMISGTCLGLVGVTLNFIIFIIRLSNLESFSIPYLTPFAPTYIEGIKNSIIKFPLKFLNRRNKYLSNNLKKEAK